jgi:hypothetical protein
MRFAFGCSFLLGIACGDATSKGLYGVTGQASEDAGDNEVTQPPPSDDDEAPPDTGPCDHPDDKGDHDEGKGKDTGGC